MPHQRSNRDALASSGECRCSTGRTTTPPFARRRRRVRRLSLLTPWRGRRCRSLQVSRTSDLRVGAAHEIGSVLSEVFLPELRKRRPRSQGPGDRAKNEGRNRDGWEPFDGLVTVTREGRAAVDADGPKSSSSAESPGSGESRFHHTQRRHRSFCAGNCANELESLTDRLPAQRCKSFRSGGAFEAFGRSDVGEDQRPGISSAEAQLIRETHARGGAYEARVARPRPRPEA